MQALYITGFMGAGKTTIGQLLAEKLALPVTDTDQFIEEQLQQTIRDIFENEGEKRFREYEAQFLQMIPTENIIVTTGGGIVLNKENMQWMKKHGKIIYLHCQVQEIIRRLSQDTSRPLLDGDKEAKILSIYKERVPYYQLADLVVDTTGKEPMEIVLEIEKWIKETILGNNNG